MPWAHRPLRLDSAFRKRGTGSGAFTATLSQNTTGVVRTGTILVGQQTIAVTERVTTQIFADVPPATPSSTRRICSIR